MKSGPKPASRRPSKAEVEKFYERAFAVVDLVDRGGLTTGDTRQKAIEGALANLSPWMSPEQISETAREIEASTNAVFKLMVVTGESRSRATKRMVREIARRPDARIHSVRRPS